MSDCAQVGDIGRGEAGPVPFHARPRRAATPDLGASRAGATHWICVNHRADDGFRVRLALRREGCEVHWPRYIDRRPKQDDVIRPMFPGYMFVLPPPSIGPALLRQIPSVIGVVGVRDRGRPDPCDHLVAHLLSLAGCIDGMAGVIDETEDNLPVARFKVGDMVSVATGPFEGMRGLLRADRGGERVTVLLELLGGDREVELSREWVASHAQ